jgi:hypothetical protein
MDTEAFIDLFQKGTKRYHLLGDTNNGLLIGLDLEGRLYTIFVEIDTIYSQRL